MTIESSAFSHEEAIPSIYTCDGDDIHPPLHFEDIPESAETLALIVDDPDAPNGTFTHWLVWNIPAETDEILADDLPDGAVEGVNSFGLEEYRGPCPPSGQHRYYFKLYALDKELNVAPGADVSQLRGAMTDSVLAEAQIMGTYRKSG